MYLKQRKIRTPRERSHLDIWFDIAKEATTLAVTTVKIKDEFVSKWKKANIAR